MKLNPMNPLIQQQIFDAEKEYWEWVPKKPNPPSLEDIEKAQFVDKTYRWNGR